MELLDLSPEDEQRIIVTAQRILDASGHSFSIVSIAARSTGVMGDARSHEFGLIICPLNTLARDTELQKELTNRLINEVRGINRCLFEIPTSF